MRIADALHRAADSLRTIVDRLRRRTAAWLAAGLPFLATCQHADHRMPPTPQAAAPAPTATVHLPLPPPPEAPIGHFHMTMYYIAAEEEVDAPKRAARRTNDRARAANDNVAAAANDGAAAANDGAAAASDGAGPPAAAGAGTGTGSDEPILAAIGGDDGTPVPDLVPMFSKDCEPLVHVSRAFAAQAKLQGTGRLRDGRLINVAGKCPCASMCFHIPPRPREWGTGGGGKPLVPFRMVAVDPRVVKMGSLLYIPNLDGLRMPGRPPHGGFIHDGCVVAADTGGGIKGRQLDLFVGRLAYVQALARRGGSHAWLRRLAVWSGDGRCTEAGGKVSRSAAGSI